MEREGRWLARVHKGSALHSAVLHKLGFAVFGGQL
jgi:hypothetical protein